MKIAEKGIAEVVELLAATPQRIETATAGATPAQLTEKADVKRWSVNETLAHLRACVDVWGETIDRMLAEDQPTLRHISPRTYLRKTNYAEVPFAESLAVFATERAALLEKLKPLTLAQWSRSATIKEREHTVFSQARRMALHEEGHCAQIEELVGKL